MSSHASGRSDLSVHLTCVFSSTIDYAQYVVTVDLWDELGSKEVNLVRSTTATPAISSTIHESFNNLETMPYRATNIAPYPPSGQMPMYGQSQPPAQQYGGSQYGQGQFFFACSPVVFTMLQLTSLSSKLSTSLQWLRTAFVWVSK